MESEQSLEEREMYRREAMGAFAHEIRTPLTSIRMVIELARRQAKDGQMVLDPELSGMLNQSVDDLQALADDLQEASRIERGKVVLSRGPCELGAAVDAARELLQPSIAIEGKLPAGIEGPWDVPHLVRAIAGMAEAANRAGDGSGVVKFTFRAEPGWVRLCFSSGVPGDEEKPIAADAGYAFFRARAFLLAMGGAVAWRRGNRYLDLDVALPRDPGVTG